MGPRGTIRVCVAITALVHVVTYLLNTQLPLHIVALGGSHAQIGWLFAVTTGVAMVLRPQVGRLDRPLRRPGRHAAGRRRARRHHAGAEPRGHPAGLHRADGRPRHRQRADLDDRQHRGGRREPGRPPGRVARPLLRGVLGRRGARARHAGSRWPRSAASRSNFAVVVGAGARRGRAGRRAPHGARRRDGAGRHPAGSWSRHAVPASIALIVITLGAATVYAFLPLHAAAGGLGRVAWFFPLMSGCTIVCRLLLRRASDRFGRARVLVPALVAIALGQVVLAHAAHRARARARRRPARLRQLDALPDAGRAGRGSHAGRRARARRSARCRARGTSASPSARR